MLSEQVFCCFFFQEEDGIRDRLVTGVQTCALPIYKGEVVGLTTSSLSLLAIESMGAIPQSVNYAVKSSFVKNIISTIPEALLSNRGIVVVPTDSNSRADFIEAIKKNVVLILGKVD